MKAKITDRLISTLQPNPSRAYNVCDETLKGFRIVVRPTGSMSFVFCYRNTGGRWLKYTLGKYGSITTTQARELAKTKSAEVRTGIDIQAEKKEAKAKSKIEKQRTLGNFFEDRYKPYCLSHMKSGEKRSAVIKRHFVDQWAEKPLKDINTWLLTSWVNEKKKAGYSAAGINHPTAALKALLNKALEWGLLESHPLSRLRPLKEDKKGSVRYLSDSENQSLRYSLDQRQQNQRDNREAYIIWCKKRQKAPPPNLSKAIYTDYLKPMVLLALNTGMRRGEIFSLDINDINLKQKLLTVKGSTAKSGTTRHIPLNDEAFSMLVTWMNETQPKDLVFPSPITGAKFDNINNS